MSAHSVIELYDFGANLRLAVTNVLRERDPARCEPKIARAEWERAIRGDKPAQPEPLDPRAEALLSKSLLVRP